MSDSPPADPQFGTLDHQLLGHPSLEGQPEQRSCRRQPVFAIRRIAPLAGTSIPAEEEFFCVESRDLTAQGFSFFISSPPTFDALILAVDASPTVKYATARVAHCTDVWVYASGLVEPADDRDAGAGADEPKGEDGQRMVLVGCQFV